MDFVDIIVEYLPIFMFLTMGVLLFIGYPVGFILGGVAITDSSTSVLTNKEIDGTTNTLTNIPTLLYQILLSPSMEIMSHLVAQ